MTYTIFHSPRSIFVTLTTASFLAAGSACGGGTSSEDTGTEGRDSGPTMDAFVAPGTDAFVAPGTDAFLPPGTDANLAPGTDAFVAPGTDANVPPGTDAYLAPGGCTTNSECAADQWCSAASCGAVGVCSVRPMGCPRIFDPVCGCDGVTYDNDCLANVAGQNVESRGECSTVGRCTSNLDCGRGQYCAGTGCDTPGTCQASPVACPDVYSPVCGCDGNTYGNDCEAAAAGVRAASRGECTTGGDCRSNADCNRLEFCAGTACDGAGTCEARPEICPGIYSPVCGCDGTTHGNSCEAAAAGTRVESVGECATTDRCDPPCARGQSCQLCRGGAYACVPEGSTC